MKLSTKKYQFIKTHCLTWLNALPIAPVFVDGGVFVQLRKEDIEDLIYQLGDLLCNIGFDTSDQLTIEGELIESLIDELNRYKWP